MVVWSIVRGVVVVVLGIVVGGCFGGVCAGLGEYFE